MKQTLEQSLEANELIESCSNDTGSSAVACHHHTDTSPNRSLLKRCVDSLGNGRPRCTSGIDSLYKLTVLYDRDAVY